MGTISTPGFYGLHELHKEDLNTLSYPVQVARVVSPHLVLLYAEDNRLQMCEIKADSINFDNIKQFCMMSPQEERLLCDYCQRENATVLCEVRAPEYNLTRWQAASIVPFAVILRNLGRKVEQADVIYLETRYWKVEGGHREPGVRVVSEPTSLSLAMDLAAWDTRSPGIVIVDSEGELCRVTSHEWEVRNKLLWDLYADLQEGRLRRLTYPRVDEHEEYYRKRMEYQLAEKNPDLWDSLSSGDAPLWKVLNAVDRTHITYRTWKTVTQ